MNVTKTREDPHPPFVELAVNEVLCLVGARLRGEHNEVRDELVRHLSCQLVTDGQRLTCTRGANTHHLEKMGIKK